MRHSPFMFISLVLFAGGLQLKSGCDLGSLGCTDRDEHHQRFTSETPPSQEHSPPTDIAVPTPRPLPGPREPSGAVALPKLGGLLVVDDEPKSSPSEGIHFLRVKGTRLVSLPVRLPPGQARLWDDLEGATATADHLYLLGSHAHRDAHRSQICRFPIHTIGATPTHLKIGGPIRCWGDHDQRRRLEQVLENAATHHGFRLPKGYRERRPKKGGLNLEGIHYDTAQKRLWLGLRSPLAQVGSKRYAVLLSAPIPNHGDKIELTFGGLMDLEGRGIRALAPGPKGSLLISAGNVDKSGRFDLYWRKDIPSPPFRLGVPRRVTPRALAQAPGWFHPEALALFGDHLYLLSDSGEWPDTPAQYLVVPTRTLNLME